MSWWLNQLQSNMNVGKMNNSYTLIRKIRSYAVDSLPCSVHTESRCTQSWLCLDAQAPDMTLSSVEFLLGFRFTIFLMHELGCSSRVFQWQRRWQCISMSRHMLWSSWLAWLQACTAFSCGYQLFLTQITKSAEQEQQYTSKCDGSQTTIEAANVAKTLLLCGIC